MTPIRWTADAVADLDRIESYIARYDAAAAGHVIATIRESTRRLRNWPESAPFLVELGVRKLTVGRYPYVVLYRVIDTVLILRVRHTSENWRR